MKVVVPETQRFVTDQTVVEPLVLVATLLLGALTIVVHRRHAVIPFLFLAFYLPIQQRVAIAEIDFNMLRLLILFGWARILLRGEFRGVRWGAVDYALLAWVTIASIIHSFGPRGGIDAAIFRAGQSYDVIGFYVVLRCWLRDIPNLRTTVAASALFVVLLAVLMAIEFSTGRNFLSVFGGVDPYTTIRDGRLRCQAGFSHPILAGSAGAILAPLCLWLAVERGRHRTLGALGFVSSALVVVFSSSSGPLLGWVAGMGGCALWFLRQHIRAIRWGFVCFAVVLHFVANRPVWAWIGSMNIIGASTSFHRVRLIDAAIAHFPEWALLGTASTAHWGVQLVDVTNHYILEGARGGFATLVAFVFLLGMSFHFVGASLRFVRQKKGFPGGQRRALLLGWALGAMLFVHAINFIGVAYFGKMMAFLVLTLAMIAGLRDACARALPETNPRATTTPRADRVRSLLRPTGPSVGGSLAR